MPDLSRWPEADALLEEALALEPDARPAFVRTRAGHDPALADALDAVLAEAGGEDGFLAPGGALSGPLFEDLQRGGAGPPADGAPALAEGTRIGPYLVLRRIGRGGMGEVYRARDTRLNRDVALKILPPGFAADPQRLARFEREARLLASLSHPHIGAIYAIEEGASVGAGPPVMALVLELVEGPTLQDVLDGTRAGRRGLPVEQVLTIALQLADALEAAHQRGIVHRDLKPANLKLSPHGLKVLDFGLARAFDPDPAAADPHGLTMAGRGAILGTAPYMSPEQARGRPVDHRTDIWAFGCLLYEMLAGERAFPGSDTQEILARVIEREPDCARLPPGTPTALGRLIRRCLQKDVRRRLAHIADARLDLEEGREPEESDNAPDPSPAAVRYNAGRLAAAFLAGALLAGAALWTVQAPGPPLVTHLAVPLPDADEIVTGPLANVLLSPDGRTVVYRARRGETMQFYRRPIDRLEPEAVAGTAGATGIFVSPDGEWIGFNDQAGRLARVPAGGGTPVRIADAPGGVAASWGADGFIVFGGGTRRSLFRVPASGGQPEAITALDEARGDLLHTFPDVLPGGRDVLFTLVGRERTELAVAGLRDGSVTILTAGRQPRYLPSGHLVFVRDGALWGAEYDAARRRLRSEPVPVLQGLDEGTGGGAAQYSLAVAGSLLYVPRRPAGEARVLVWVDRDGREEVLPLPPRQYSRATLSPDGTRIAVAVADAGNQDIWIHHLERGTFTRLTSDAAVDTAPVWSPDGRRVAFRSDRDGGGLFMAPADGATPPVQLTRPGGPIHTPYGFTPDGRVLLFSEFRSYSDQGSGAVPVDGGEIEWLVDGSFAEIRPQVSPDGRWLAYQSDESGEFEVYVRPYPDVAAGRSQVSSGGGTSPLWTRDGRELIFFSGGTLMRAVVGRDGSVGIPQPVRDLHPFAERLGPTFDVTPDGRRFLIVRGGAQADDRAARTLLLAGSWAEELRRLIAARP